MRACTAWPCVCLLLISDPVQGQAKCARGPIRNPQSSSSMKAANARTSTRRSACFQTSRLSTVLWPCFQHGPLAAYKCVGMQPCVA
eukprot:366413-Chlamydomonas_euryale.AAC.10